MVILDVASFLLLFFFLLSFYFVIDFIIITAVRLNTYEKEHECDSNQHVCKKILLNQINSQACGIPTIYISAKSQFSLMRSKNPKHFRFGLHSSLSIRLKYMTFFSLLSYKAFTIHKYCC